jgi:hypothetical protein
VADEGGLQLSLMCPAGRGVRAELAEGWDRIRPWRG